MPGPSSARVTRLARTHVVKRCTDSRGGANDLGQGSQTKDKKERLFMGGLQDIGLANPPMPVCINKSPFLQLVVSVINERESE